MTKKLLLILCLSIILNVHSNSLQKKYYKRGPKAQGGQCRELGLFAKLRRAPYNCYMDMRECQASIDTITKKIDGKFVNLYADLIKLKPGKKLEFQMRSPCPFDDYYDFVMGLQGLGYAQSKKHIPLVSAVAKRADDASSINRMIIVDTLWRLGAKSEIPTMTKMLDLNGNSSFKQQIIRYLTEWKSDAAVSFCKQKIRNAKDKDLKESCMLYLGHRKTPGVTKDILSNINKSPVAVAWSLALLGDSSAKEKLSKHLKKNKNWNPKKKIPFLVALVNLGKNDHMTDLKTFMSGKKALNEKEKARFEKRIAREDKMIARAKKRSGKSAEKQIEAATKRKNKILEKMNKVDPNVIKVATASFPFIKNSSALSAAKNSFKEAMENTDSRKWESYIYPAISLAQSGDSDAINFLKEQLNDSKDNIKEVIIKAAGNLSYRVSNIHTQGTGIIKDKLLVSDIVSYIGNQSNKKKKGMAIKAIMNIKSI